MMKTSIDTALEIWGVLACYNSKTDLMVNDLLEEIAGEKYVVDDDDPIYTTIKNLSEEERQAFIEGCEKIKTQMK